MKTREQKEFDLREVMRTIRNLQIKKERGEIAPVEADVMILKGYERAAELAAELATG